MALLVVLYYVGAESYLIDPRVAELGAAQAIGLGVAFMSAAGRLYMLLCASPLARNGWLLALLLLVLGGALAWALTAAVQRPRRLHSLRRDHRHDHGRQRVPVIMPGQRKLVAHWRAAATPIRLGRAGQAALDAQHLPDPATAVHHDQQPLPDDLWP
jgi:uncharacterized membrane protein